MLIEIPPIPTEVEMSKACLPICRVGRGRSDTYPARNALLRIHLRNAIKIPPFHRAGPTPSRADTATAFHTSAVWAGTVHGHGSRSYMYLWKSSL